MHIQSTYLLVGRLGYRVVSYRTKLGLNISDRVCQNTPSYIAILMECGNKTIKCRKTKTHYSVSDSLLLNRNLFRMERFTFFIFSIWSFVVTLKRLYQPVKHTLTHLALNLLVESHI